MNKLLSDIKVFSSKIPQFFTTWSVFIFILSNIFIKYMPYFLLLCSQNLIISTSFFGFYLLNKFGSNLLKSYKSFSLYHVDIFNYTFHIFPLIYIFLIKKNFLIVRNFYDIFYSIIFSCFISFIYLKLNNPSRIYSFTGYKNFKLISIILIIYIMCFFIK